MRVALCRRLPLWRTLILSDNKSIFMCVERAMKGNLNIFSSHLTFNLDDWKSIIRLESSRAVCNKTDDGGEEIMVKFRFFSCLLQS